MRYKKISILFFTKLLWKRECTYVLASTNYIQELNNTLNEVLSYPYDSFKQEVKKKVDDFILRYGTFVYLTKQEIKRTYCHPAYQSNFGIITPELGGNGSEPKYLRLVLEPMSSFSRFLYPSLRLSFPDIDIDTVSDDYRHKYIDNIKSMNISFPKSKGSFLITNKEKQPLYVVASLYLS